MHYYEINTRMIAFSKKIKYSSLLSVFWTFCTVDTQYSQHEHFRKTFFLCLVNNNNNNSVSLTSIFIKSKRVNEYVSYPAKWLFLPFKKDVWWSLLSLLIILNIFLKGIFPFWWHSFDRTYKISVRIFLMILLQILLVNEKRKFKQKKKVFLKKLDLIKKNVENCTKKLVKYI